MTSLQEEAFADDAQTPDSSFGNEKEGSLPVLTAVSREISWRPQAVFLVDKLY